MSRSVFFAAVKFLQNSRILGSETPKSEHLQLQNWSFPSCGSIWSIGRALDVSYPWETPGLARIGNHLKENQLGKKFIQNLGRWDLLNGRVLGIFDISQCGNGSVSHVFSVGNLIWNQWPFLTGISQTINQLQYRFFTVRTHKRRRKSQVHEPPGSYEHEDISFKKSTSSKPVVRHAPCQVGERTVHWFHLTMESNKTMKCIKWSNQVKLIQTINQINSKSRNGLKLR